MLAVCFNSIRIQLGDGILLVCCFPVHFRFHLVKIPWITEIRMFEVCFDSVDTDLIGCTTFVCRLPTKRTFYFFKIPWITETRVLTVWLDVVDSKLINWAIRGSITHKVDIRIHRIKLSWFPHIWMLYIWLQGARLQLVHRLI